MKIRDLWISTGTKGFVVNTSKPKNELNDSILFREVNPEREHAIEKMLIALRHYSAGSMNYFMAQDALDAYIRANK